MAKEKGFTVCVQSDVFLVLILLFIVILFVFVKQKRLQANIEEYNKNLEQRVKEEVEKNREQEKQLLQQSRMAQMGEMLSMIAHQWRQPLAAIGATSIALNMRVELGTLEDEHVTEAAQKISEYAQHLSQTIEDFRNFFKPTREKAETDFTELVDGVLSIIGPSLTNKEIALRLDLKCQQRLRLYVNEMKQVILNLIQNAEDVLLSNQIQKPAITIRSFSEGGNSILEIEDNGGGIPEAILDKIYEPYFSTKTKSGTGLGLYMSKIIVEEHCGGRLEAYNGRSGAVFQIAIDSKLHVGKRE